MAARTSQVFKSTVLLTVYAACLCLVLSFILFEVLDIDGSDFPIPISRTLTVVKLADPPHDLKRTHSDPPSHGWTPVSLRFELTKPDALLRHVALLSASATAADPRRDHRTLARASLPDSAPSA